jgi:hypothetical protein
MEYIWSNGNDWDFAWSSQVWSQQHASPHTLSDQIFTDLFKVLPSRGSCLCFNFLHVLVRNSEILSHPNLGSTYTFWIKHVRVRHVFMSVFDTDTILMITLNYIVFSNYYWCCCVSVCIISRVYVGVRAS